MTEDLTAMAAVRCNPSATIAGRSRRAVAWALQAPRRAAEHAMRRHAAVLCNEPDGRGFRHCELANRLGVPCRTLRRWRQSGHVEDRCRPRGRPCKESPVVEREAVLGWLEREGCHMGLPSLRAAFPWMPRCELQELQREWREAHRAAHRHSVSKLAWHKPGPVWAMDHSQPPELAGRTYPSILSVRDLGSGMQLAWRPVPDETAQTTIAVVQSLFDEHGPPLVVKSDNGAAFISHELDELLSRYQVAWLPSPPRRPSYNGSCEAAIGGCKIRTEHFAQRDHDGCWTSESMEAARRQSNELARPKGHLRPTPTERWATRAPITKQEREEFYAVVRENRQKIQDVTTRVDRDNLNQERCVQRQAVRQALLDLGLLTITRRSITLPFKLAKAAKIS
jgi:putative transposase